MSFTCTNPETLCWELLVVTRDGCDWLYTSITTEDATGIPLEILEASASAVTPLDETRLGFATTDERPVEATLSVITCVN